MKKIVYSPDYKDKLQRIKKYLRDQFGNKIEKEIIQKIRSQVCELKNNDESGYSVQKMYGIDTEYRCIFVSHNYIFYRVDNDFIFVVNIYNEREDFMRDLFGISMTSTDEDE